MITVRHMRRLVVVGFVASIVCNVTPVGAETRYVLGLFAPEMPFAGPGPRFSYVQGLAQHLSASLGNPVEGKAYKGAAEFNKDVKGKKIDVAVVGSFFVPTLKDGRVIATARQSSDRDAMWSIMTKDKASITALKGKTLQIPTFGTMTVGFIQHALLASIIDPKSHFKVTQSPDLTSATTAVKLGRADAVVAPVSTAGLKPVMAGLHVAPPAVVILDKTLTADVVAKIERAILAYGAAGANVTGWVKADGSAYAVLASASRKKTHRMVLVGSAEYVLEAAELANLSKLSPELPVLEELFWVP